MSNARDPEWLTRERVLESLEFDPDTGVFRWRVTRNGFVRAGSVAGQVLRSGYRSIAFDRRGVLEHRLAWFVVHGTWPVGEVDHINRDRADNRMVNLRCVTRSQNMHNTKRKRQPKSGSTGVYERNGAWWARISDGKEYHFGPYETKASAQLAYALAKDRALRGERAASPRLPPIGCGHEFEAIGTNEFLGETYTLRVKAPEAEAARVSEEMRRMGAALGITAFVDPKTRPYRRRARAIEAGNVDADGVIQTEEATA